MRTNIVINDQLMKQAIKLAGLHTKKEAVEQGLKLLVQLHEQRKIKSYRGKLKWRGNLQKMRTDS